MRIAILTDTDRVYVEFPNDVFRLLLITYIRKYNGDVNLAMDQIEQELKELTITK